jgi:hypothetical protein
MRIFILLAITVPVCAGEASAASLNGIFYGVYTCTPQVWSTFSSFIVDGANNVKLVEAQMLGNNEGGFIAEYFGTYNQLTRSFTLPSFKIIYNSGSTTAPVTGTLSADGKTVQYQYSGLACDTVTVKRVKAKAGVGPGPRSIGKLQSHVPPQGALH